MAHGYRYISADSHIEISPDRWRDRVPEKYRDRAPRLVHLGDSGTGVLVENRPLKIRWVHGSGLPPEQWGHEGGMDLDEMAGGGSPEQRLQEQDQDGVDAEILFADVGGRNDWMGIADDDAYNAVVRAYNEFLVEEYSAVDARRLIGMGIIPERGIDSAIAELEYCARADFKGINLNTWPSGKPRLSAEDDRFWAAAVDLDMPVTVHTAFAGTRREPGGGAPDLARRICTYGVKGAPIAATLAVYGVFERFPKLQVYFAENQICWVPGFLDSMNVLYKKHRYYHERVQGLKLPADLPGDIVRAHCLWGFMDDRVGVELRHYLGTDKVMWSSDFPHAPSDWPYSMGVIERIFEGVPEEETYQMVAANCIEFFHLEDCDRSLAESREPAAVSR